MKKKWTKRGRQRELTGPLEKRKKGLGQEVKRKGKKEWHDKNFLNKSWVGVQRGKKNKR